MAVGKGLDPVCRWKLEDANDRGLGYGAEHDRRGTQSVNGRIPPDRVKRALEKQEAAVSRCLEAKDGGANRAPVLRVRLEVSPSGEVGAVVTDYRAPIEAERAACVSATLKKVQLGKTDGGPAIIVYGFPAGK